jgi:hypothetical protein
VGPNVWGKGATLSEALKKARQNGPCRSYAAYIVHPVSGVGPPAEFHRVGKARI